MVRQRCLLLMKRMRRRRQSMGGRISATMWHGRGMPRCAGGSHGGAAMDAEVCTGGPVAASPWTLMPPPTSSSITSSASPSCSWPLHPTHAGRPTSPLLDAKALPKPSTTLTRHRPGPAMKAPMCRPPCGSDEACRLAQLLFPFSRDLSNSGVVIFIGAAASEARGEIGRASCRERVYLFV